MVIFLYFTRLVATAKFLFFYNTIFFLGVRGLALALIPPSMLPAEVSVTHKLLLNRFETPNVYLNLFLIVFLLMTLLVVVKLTESFKGMLETSSF